VYAKDISHQNKDSLHNNNNNNMQQQQQHASGANEGNADSQINIINYLGDAHQSMNNVPKSEMKMIETMKKLNP
jgi:hypothetical protein